MGGDILVEKQETIVARIDERTKAIDDRIIALATTINDRLKSLLDRLVIVEKVAVNANSDTDKILALKTAHDGLELRVGVLETCQTKKDAQGSTLESIWGMVNTPMGIAVMAIILYLWGKATGWALP
jgi:hypothetical protein